MATTKKKLVRNLSTPESRAFWAGVERSAWESKPLSERIATWLETPGDEKWTESETRFRFALAEKIRSGEWSDEAWDLESKEREGMANPPSLSPPWEALDDS